MSPRGFEDWGVNPTGEQLSPVIASSELAVRLGAISTYSRTGDTIFADSFERGRAHWENTSSGVGAAQALSAFVAASGGFAMVLTTGSTGEFKVGIRRRIFLPVASRLGLEAAYALVNTIVAPELRITHWDGTNRTDWRARYDNANDRLQVWTGAGAWTTVQSGVAVPLAQLAFIPFKVVVDPDTLRYVRVMFGRFVADASAQAPPQTADTANPETQPEAVIIGDAASTYANYLDDVIYTQNEP